MIAKTTTGPIVMLDPMDDGVVPAVHAAPRVAELNGKAIGFLFNGHNSGAKLFDATIEKMTSEFRFSGVLSKVKPILGAPMTPAAIAELATQCDVVVLGVGA